MIALCYLVCVVNAHLRVQRSGRLQDELPGSISMGGQTGTEHAKQKHGNRQDSSIRPLIAEMGAGRSALSFATFLERVVEKKTTRRRQPCFSTKRQSVAIGWHEVGAAWQTL